MSRGRFLWLAAAALLVISIALQLNSRRNERPEQVQGTALIPGLASELDTVSAVSVRKGAAASAVILHRSGAQWTVAERGDYPADAAKLRKLLIALGDAKIVEEKTSDPANFAIIGVEDPTQVGAAGAEITVTARDGSHAVIIGKPAGQGNFARRGGKDQSFIVEPAISLETQPRFWIEPRLLDVTAASIQRIEVKFAGGGGYVVRRLKPNEDEFELQGAPAGRKAADSHTLAPSASMLSALTAEDVAAASAVDFSKPSTATLTLTDGKVIALTGAQAGDKRWIQLRADADAALETRARGRAFEVASYRYDAIFRPIEQLLVPKESPKPKTPQPKTAPAKS